MEEVFEKYNLLNRVRSNEPPFRDVYERADAEKDLAAQGLL